MDDDIMKIAHYIVPPTAYPRYAYTRQHVTPLLKRFKDLSEKCHITDPYPFPIFDDVNIYVISDNDSEILSVDALATRKTSEIKRNDLVYADVDAFRREYPDAPATIHVASYGKAKMGGKILEFGGQCNVYIAGEEEEIEVTSPESKFPGQAVISVKTRKTFADEMGILLERIVFRHLFDRVKVLSAFLELEPSAGLFAEIDQIMQKKLNQKFEKSRSSALIKRDPLTLHNEWCNARLDAIESKISSSYGKDILIVRDQLLQTGRSGETGRKITPIKICEHIVPYYIDVSDDVTPSSTREIPKSLSEIIILTQKSQETTSKAVRLETRFKNHVDRVFEHEDEIKQLHGACIGMYRRSKVPEYERPRRVNSGVMNERAARDILKIEGVMGCGFRYRSLDIYIKDTLSAEERVFIEPKIKDTAEKHGISEYKLRTEQEKITHFAEYEVGSQITSRLNRSASLGGFGYKGENNELVSFVARHLADDGKPLYMTDESGKKFVVAAVIEPKEKSTRYASLDIAVARVVKKYQPQCQTKFKDSSGDPLESTLQSFEDNDIEWLKGLPVHIWGASSNPGLGTIIIPDFYIEGMKRLVKIEDRHPVDAQSIEDFSTSGDSGAFVCADDPDGEVVHVISMLMGSSNFDAKKKEPSIKGEYLSIRLRDGIIQLEQEHGDTFQLC